MGDAMHGYPYGYAPWGGIPQHPHQPPPMPPPPMGEEYDDEDEEDDEEDQRQQQEHADDLEQEEDEEEEYDDDEDEEAQVVEDPETEDEVEAVAKSELPKNRKRPRPSAFAYLQSLVQPDSYEMSGPAQSILKDLLRQEHIQLAEPETDADAALRQATARLQSKRVVDSGMQDDEILELAKKNEISYLGSFLKAVEEGKGEPVAARHLCRRCCLAVNPVYVPASMDAEEFALAAMEFLERELETNDHPHLPRLPLIQADRPENDIRKRAYVKAYGWSLSDILDHVVYLENIFLSDASAYKWLRREAFGPMNMDETASDVLFHKGRFRASSSKKKAPSSRKKTKPHTSNNSVNSGPTNKDPVAKEASRIVQQAGSRSCDDSV